MNMNSKNNIEAGMEIWASTMSTSFITLVTLGIGKVASKVSEHIAESKLSFKFGTTVINNIENTGGFSVTEINSKVKQFNSFRIPQKTIDTLLKNPKCMMLSDDILNVLGTMWKIF